MTPSALGTTLVFQYSFKNTIKKRKWFEDSNFFMLYIFWFSVFSSLVISLIAILFVYYRCQLGVIHPSSCIPKCSNAGFEAGQNWRAHKKFQVFICQYFVNYLSAFECYLKFITSIYTFTIFLKDLSGNLKSKGLFKYEITLFVGFSNPPPFFSHTSSHFAPPSVVISHISQISRIFYSWAIHKLC